MVSYDYRGEALVNDANRRLTEHYLTHLQDASKRAGSELVVFYIPVTAEVESYRRKQEISRDEQAIKEIIEAHGGALHSCTPVLAAAPESIRELYFVEGHWTPRAHFLAGAIWQIILKTCSGSDRVAN